MGWFLLSVERYLSCLNDNLLFMSPVCYCLPTVPPLFLSPITSSPSTYSSLPLRSYLVRSLQAINSSATTCGFWLSLMRASILRT